MHLGLFMLKMRLQPGAEPGTLLGELASWWGGVSKSPTITWPSALIFSHLGLSFPFQLQFLAMPVHIFRLH